MSRPSLTPEDSRLLRLAADWPGCAWSDLTRDHILEITRREGIDFVTALLYDRLRASEAHGTFIRAIDDQPADLTNLGDITVAIVPGGFYREHPESGADGAFILEQARLLGCKTALVPLDSFGSVRGNAERLCDWLTRQPTGPTILVSMSKAGAEVRLALDDSRAESLFAGVVGWVNVSGLVRGTPMVNWLMRRRIRAMMIRLMFWWKRYSWAGVQELAWGDAGLFTGEFRVPDHLAVVHLFGFPLKRHLTRPLAQRGHERLTPLGPNDGGANVLADLLDLPGMIYPVWGADHYLQPAWDIQVLLRQVLCYIACSRFDRVSKTGANVLHG